jgi:hypothetical protein
LAHYAPDRADRLIRDLAASPAWDRQALVHIVGHRLTSVDCDTLAATTDPQQLVDAMAATGVLAPVTMLEVLHAEHIDATTVAGLIPATGVPIPDAIRRLHQDWGVDRLDAGAAVGATVEELRAAGCTPVELLAAAPRETLRTFDTRESTWEIAAATLLEAGYTPAEAVAHLAAHAPTSETFAAGVATIVEQPLDAFTFAARRAQPEDLAVLSERYGLDPLDTGQLLAAAGVAIDRTVETVWLRCERDSTVTLDIVERALGVEGSVAAALLTPGLVADGVVELPAPIPVGDSGQLVESEVDW